MVMFLINFFKLFNELFELEFYSLDFLNFLMKCQMTGSYVEFSLLWVSYLLFEKVLVGYIFLWEWLFDLAKFEFKSVFLCVEGFDSWGEVGFENFNPGKDSLLLFLFVL